MRIAFIPPPLSECPMTCAKTGSPVERMNITLVPGGNMVVSVKFHFSESEQNVLP